VQAIKKYKARRLNIDGTRMEKDVHYDETYSPVASWNCVYRINTIIEDLKTVQLEITVKGTFKISWGSTY
jgi:hypothetical protein